ncbi:MAG: hypothetical protein CMK32_10025 [Porticoccaceae bacterium]|nr:hypothetical protein [Porticoccaceae bacterium]
MITKLKALSLSPVSSSQIYACEFPFDRHVVPGIACSEIEEHEGAGTNEKDDFMYGVMLTRVFGGSGQGDYHQDQSAWRQKVRSHFHRQLLGNIDNEIITKVSPGRINLTKQWRDWGIDGNTMEIWTWVREGRDS